MPIKLVPYDAAWPHAFQAATAGITSALGSIALEVEHVGSTAIPAMAAKPVIDVLVLVDRYDPEEAYVRPLVDIGYSYGHRDESHVFLTGMCEGMAVHVHVVEVAGPDAADMVTFRDYLGAHPAEAARYVTLKRRLAAVYDSGDEYAGAKSSYVREVLRRATLPVVRVRAFEAADLGACVAISNAVHPSHPIDLDDAGAGLRDAKRLELRRYVAEDAAGGISRSIVGWGQIAHMLWHFDPRKYELRLEVDPGHRRQGVASGLLDRLLLDLRAREALSARASATESDTDSMAFLTNLGFREVWRNLLSRLDVAGFDQARFARAAERVEAQGIRLTTLPEELARDAEVLRKVYEMSFGTDRDEQEIGDLTVPPLEQYVADEVYGPVGIPEAWFLARDGDRIVGVSTLQRVSGSLDVVETGYTGVHPDYRGRGIAMALKLRTIAYAADHGIRCIRTESKAYNERMLSINAALGFESQPARIAFELDL